MKRIFVRVAAYATGPIVVLLRAGSVAVPAVVLASAIVGLTPSTAGADPRNVGTASQQAVESVRQTTTFGTLGVADGQTLRLSAVRSGNDDPGAACKVDLKFFDTHGDEQGTGVSVDLEPRQAALFDLPRGDIHQESEGRAQVYAVVDVATPTKQRDELTCHVAMSIEIFDQQDGRTQIYQGALASTKTPQVLNCCTICCQIYQGRCILERQRCAVPPNTPVCPVCVR